MLQDDTVFVFIVFAIQGGDTSVNAFAFLNSLYLTGESEGSAIVGDSAKVGGGNDIFKIQQGEQIDMPGNLVWSV